MSDDGHDYTMPPNAESGVLWAIEQLIHEADTAASDLRDMRLRGGDADHLVSWSLACRQCAALLEGLRVDSTPEGDDDAN